MSEYMWQRVVLPVSLPPKARSEVKLWYWKQWPEQSALYCPINPVIDLSLLHPVPNCTHGPLLGQLAPKVPAASAKIRAQFMATMITDLIELMVGKQQDILSEYKY
jgi:hypothetical protein